MTHSTFSIHPIAIAKTPYSQKFGIPRQPGLVTASQTIIELSKEFTIDSVRGLEEFDYIWVSFVFHDAIEEGYAQLVRPPRLGGKIKKGIFATRSPHRPNHLGLSLLKLLFIKTTSPIQLICASSDLLDGTPIVDIKPYIPFIEAQSNAKSGFVTGIPEILPVSWDECTQKDMNLLQYSDISKEFITQCLAQDPRPAYQNNPTRLYIMPFKNIEVRFYIRDNIVFVQSVLIIKD